MLNSEESCKEKFLIAENEWHRLFLIKILLQRCEREEVMDNDSKSLIFDVHHNSASSHP